MKSILYTTIAIFLLSFSACKKTAVDPEETSSGTNSITIEFDHVFGSMPLELNSSDWCITDNDDSLKFSTFRYYVSNIRLKKADGSYWTEDESYYLIDLENALDLEIKNVPAGNYTELEYIIGVDSTHNVSGAQTGALSTTNGMFWSWNSGYIFLKAEGSYQNGSSNTGNFVYHVGGFKNSNNSNAIQTVVHDLSIQNLEVSKEVAPEIHMMVDVAKMFNGGPAPLNVTSTSTIHMPGASAVAASNNYKQMFEIDHIHQ